ncbi:MAG: fibronectin type III domain-containing protein [FCB group bacterium]|nr:fibronectin type III domain-containing protein [FCB group bacterium]
MRKIILLILLLLIISITGCDRYVNSKNPVRSLPQGVPVPTNLQVVINNESVTLNWDISDSSQVAKYRVYVSENDSLNEHLYDSTTTSSITITGLQVNHIYRLRVAAVLKSGLEGDKSLPIAAHMSLLSMSINNNNKYTNSQDVSIGVNTSNQATEVIFSEDSTFSDAVYEPFSAHRNFKLSAGDGVKTVYARLQFADGSQSGDLLSDDIILDTKAHIDSVFYTPAEKVFSPGDTIIFSVDAQETEGQASVSFTGVSSVELFDDGTNGDLLSGDGIYTGRYIVPLEANLNDGLVTGNFTDAAGNRAPSVVSQAVLNINTPPDTVELVGYVNPSGDSVYFHWTESNDNDFESYRIYENNNATVDTSGTLIQYITNQTTTNFSIELPTSTTYFRVFVFDRHGAFTGSNIVEFPKP